MDRLKVAKELLLVARELVGISVRDLLLDVQEILDTYNIRWGTVDIPKHDMGSMSQTLLKAFRSADVRNVKKSIRKAFSLLNSKPVLTEDRQAYQVGAKDLAEMIRFVGDALQVKTARAPDTIEEAVSKIRWDDEFKKFVGSPVVLIGDVKVEVEIESYHGQTRYDWSFNGVDYNEVTFTIKGLKPSTVEVNDFVDGLINSGKFPRGTTVRDVFANKDAQQALKRVRFPGSVYCQAKFASGEKIEARGDDGEWEGIFPAIKLDEGIEVRLGVKLRGRNYVLSIIKIDDKSDLEAEIGVATYEQVEGESDSI